MSTLAVKKLIPREVYSKLTQEQRKELNDVFIEMNSQKLPSFPFAKVKTDNPGLQYLAMNDSLKYSLLTLSSISEDEIMELVSYDAECLDLYHRIMWKGDPKQGLWEQRFSTTMAALGNPNLSEECAFELLTELESATPVRLSPLEFLSTVAQQLEDKWDLNNFNSSVLQAIVTLFELYGLTEKLPQFKRLQRKAAHRETD